MKKNTYLVFIAALLLFALFLASCDKKTTELNRVATPIFSPAGGTYNEVQEVSISCAMPDATIRYTTDGSNPGASSSEYSSPLTVSQNTTLKARAFKEGWADSEIASAVYEISLPEQVATPVFDPAGGSYDEAQEVSISCALPDAIIRYTTDGSVPDSLSLEYSSPVRVSIHTTLKARAFKEDWADSEIANAHYVIAANPDEMIYVSGGTFNNGTSDVTLSSFYIAKYQTTQAEYEAVMGSNPSYFEGNPDHPIERVSWFNAIEYCNRLSMQEELTPCYTYSTSSSVTFGTDPSNWPSGWNTNSGNHKNFSCDWTANGYRLPTEMEWMFAAKGGNQSQGYTYSGSNDINAVAWYIDNSLNMGSNHPDYGTHAVGTKFLNELGIYDMSGNVWEWCWDRFGTYPGDAQTDPHGAESGSDRVLRGGSWNSNTGSCIVSYRVTNDATFRDYHVGFRVCRISL